MKRLITLCVLVGLVFAATAQMPVDTRTVKGCAASNDLAHKAVNRIKIIADEEMLAVIYQGMDDGRVCYAAVIKCTSQSFSKDGVFDIYYRKDEIEGPVKAVAVSGDKDPDLPQAPYNTVMRVSGKKQF